MDLRLPEPCFLVVVDDAVPRLDMDPSLPDASEIVDVEWRPLYEMADDPQVSCVIAALRRCARIRSVNVWEWVCVDRG